MNILIVLIASVWIARILANVASYVHLWFVKEYRVDRMLIHLGTRQGRRILFLPFRRPPVSPKAIFLVFATLTALFLLFVSMPGVLLFKLFLLDAVSFPVTFLFVLAVNIPVGLYHQLVIRAAVGTLRAHKKMTVVGITGSYGKTSTKDFLSTILSQQFRVIKTEASKNAPIGIAETILSSLKPNDQIFVVEMGAYKRGEIFQMARMVLPEIAILTAINPQHQDLFGSIEHTKKAKYELVQGLVGRKLVICNADTSGTKEMGQWAERDGYAVWWYTRKDQNSEFKIQKRKIFSAENVHSDMRGVSFDCRLGKEKVSVQARVLGEHQTSNLLAAMAGAVACGMDLAAAAKAVSFIVPTPNVMELIPGIHGATFVNDTFNNNPDAAIAALRFLTQFPGKKFLVFQPMIELGSFTNSAHKEVGELAGQLCSAIILTNRNYYAAFEQGVRKTSRSVPVVVWSPARAAKYLREHLTKGDVVLFKGKEAEGVFRRTYV